MLTHYLKPKKATGYHNYNIISTWNSKTMCYCTKHYLHEITLQKFTLSMCNEITILQQLHIMEKLFRCTSIFRKTIRLWDCFFVNLFSKTFASELKTNNVQLFGESSNQTNYCNLVFRSCWWFISECFK